jgi:hypothetical protein
MCLRSFCLFLTLLFVVGCSGTTTPLTPATTATSAAKPAAKTPSASKAVKTIASPFRFETLDNKTAGIDFVHESGMTEEKYFASANGSGVAIIDYDGDGKMDLYFATCNELPLAAAPKESNKLYKNMGNGKFKDVTAEAKVDYKGFCHGVIAADFDSDGDTDMLLCNYGANVLYLNNGDGTFKDVTKEAGVATPNWSSGGAALDYDNDGDLDIYVANYGLFDIKTNGKQWCGDHKKGVRQYCSPATITTVRHILYRNDGVKNGVPHFTDQIVEVGIGRDFDKGYGHGFGVVAMDLNDDGKIDLYVANDQNPAFVFYNKGNGKFEDATEISGAGFDDNGKAQSGMGADAEDADGDGLPDIIRTNFREETTSYYQNQGKGLFLEQSAFVGIAAPSMPWVKWGCALADFDNDGYPDIFVTNGHVDDNYYLVGKDEPYKQPPLFFANRAGKSFETCDNRSGPYFASDHVGRGAAFGDLDDDGRLEIIINHKDDAPAILMNRTPGGNHWIRLILKGTKSNRDAIGAKVEVSVGDKKISRQRKGGGSMEATNDPRLLIGVGSATIIDKIVVKWPSGSPDTVLEKVKVDSSINVEEGVVAKPVARAEQ